MLSLPMMINRAFAGGSLRRRRLLSIVVSRPPLAVVVLEGRGRGLVATRRFAPGEVLLECRSCRMAVGFVDYC